jgi:hypothetical protein
MFLSTPLPRNQTPITNRIILRGMPYLKGISYRLLVVRAICMGFMVDIIALQQDLL